ncbi:MAG TPA: hypothetical protein VE441_14710, partial [Mycobacterium sp.]|nr:hypothetical protein [Mycobacterium sp.]
MRRLSKSLATLGVATLAAVAVVLTAPSASADYGGGAAKNTWQIELSVNCNNPTLCSQMGGAGGEWIWGELDQTVGANPTYTGDAQITFCAHGGGFSGAGHTSEDISSWKVGTNGNFWITGGTDTDYFQGQKLVHPIWGDIQPDPANPTVPASPANPA